MNPLRGWRTRLRHRLGGSAASAPADAFVPVGFEHDGDAGCLDRIEGAPLPIVRAFGWWTAPSALPLRLDTHARSGLAPAVFSRILRADAAAADPRCGPFSGFRADFVLDPGEQPQRLRLGDRALHAFPAQAAFATLDPHYRHFFTQDKVMGRASVYGSGPPTDVSPEFKAFTRLAEGRVLDFGCGNGDVVADLRRHDRDATGLELDEPRIREALKPEAAPNVVLYPGGAPLPFDAGSFDSIVSTEVIEHVPDVARYVPEFHRVLRPGGRVLVTTPDITSIPSSFPANCVPWHLLESTHVNFFTPASVAALFASHFEPEATYCLGATRVNGFFVPGSIGAVFVRRQGMSDSGANGP